MNGWKGAVKIIALLPLAIVMDVLQAAGVAILWGVLVGFFNPLAGLIVGGLVAIGRVEGWPNVCALWD